MKYFVISVFVVALISCDSNSNEGAQTETVNNEDLGNIENAEVRFDGIYSNGIEAIRFYNNGTVVMKTEGLDFKIDDDYTWLNSILPKSGRYSIRGNNLSFDCRHASIGVNEPDTYSGKINGDILHLFVDKWDDTTVFNFRKIEFNEIVDVVSKHDDLNRSELYDGVYYNDYRNDLKEHETFHIQYKKKRYEIERQLWGEIKIEAVSLKPKQMPLTVCLEMYNEKYSGNNLDSISQIYLALKDSLGKRDCGFFYDDETDRYIVIKSSFGCGDTYTFSKSKLFPNGKTVINESVEVFYYNKMGLINQIYWFRRRINYKEVEGEGEKEETFKAKI